MDARAVFKRRFQVRESWVTRSFAFAGGGCYDAERAVEAHAKIAKLDAGALSKPVKVEVPYTGIGIPPPRPGGDLVVVGREGLRLLIELFEDLRQLGLHGRRIYVSGPIGCGKTTMLRELAVLLFNRRGPTHRVVCIRNTIAALEDFTEQMKSALSFTYATDVGVPEVINGLQSHTDVEQFLAARMKQQKEEFFFIIDGGEVFDNRQDELDTKRTRVLHNINTVISMAKVSVVGLSPMADRLWERKRKAVSDWLWVNNGFQELEFVVYMEEVSLLNRVCLLDDTERRLEDVVYFAGNHPLSLALLNSCCWQLAKKRYGGSDLGPFCSAKGLTADQVLEQLGETEDWEELLDTYLSSEEIDRVRVLARETLSKVKVQDACYSRKSMMKLDRRFVYGDPDSENPAREPCYVNPLIEKIYTEEMRMAESKSCVEGGAWEPYCRYLLDHAVVVNWAEMGWICEDFVGEVISLKGLKLDGELRIPKAHVSRFGTVPEYSSWIGGVKDRGGVLLFLPLRYNYGSVDGVLVVNLGGKLHFIAIQVTVNDKDHQKSARDFMTWEFVTQWIPEQHRSEWNLHYAFLCLRTLPAQDVVENMKELRGGTYYGTVAYRLHTVSFMSAFSGLVSESVMRTLEDVAQKRDDLKRPPAAAAAAVFPTAQASSSRTASPAAAAAVEDILARKMTKSMLQNLAKQHKVDFTDKDKVQDLRTKLAARIVST